MTPKPPADGATGTAPPPLPEGMTMESFKALPWRPANKCRYLAEQAAAGTPVPAKTYQGGCHCGAIAFDVTLQPPLEDGHTVIQCSCSACRRLGYLLVYPTRDNVVFRNRGGGQKRCGVYQFNLKAQEHLFCKRCGASVMIDFLDRFHPDFDGYGVNVRALRDVDLDKLSIERTDGASYIPPFVDTAGQWYEESDVEN